MILPWTVGSKLAFSWLCSFQVQIQNKKIDLSHVTSKCGSLDNIHHRPGKGLQFPYKEGNTALQWVCCDQKVAAAVPYFQIWILYVGCPGGRRTAWIHLSNLSKFHELLSSDCGYTGKPQGMTACEAKNVSR